jgi:predicted amino acid-binding ACT domain protein
MTDHEADATQAVFERDQNDAAIHDISKQVMRHYTMMRAVKMSEESAVTLTLAFQNALMGGVDVTYEIVGAND